jgi:hypothetical protein
MTSKVGFGFGSGINNSGSTTFFVAQEYLKGHCHKSNVSASCQSDTDKKLEFIWKFDIQAITGVNDTDDDMLVQHICVEK